MATLTNTSKNAGSLSPVSKPLMGGQVFYAWLFWFTISGYSTSLTNTSKNAGTLILIAKS
ncbi:hypothetical protein UNPF46_08570 [Bradyrhizobium sp. UNPF46]|nr:hypothetical protein UNPF46_08570 [Bradyrhizobium sp. UNPF46]